MQVDIQFKHQPLRTLKLMMHHRKAEVHLLLEKRRLCYLTRGNKVLIIAKDSIILYHHQIIKN